MNATFFGLAFLAAANPKLVGVDLLLIENRRPRVMFSAFLAGGLAVSLTVGFVDVLAVQANTVKTQGSLSGALELASGLALLVLSVLVGTGRVHRLRGTPAFGHGGAPMKMEAWARGVLRQPHIGPAVVIGGLAGTPGASYVLALRGLITGHSSTAVQIVAVVLFSLIQFLVIIVPLVFLGAWPEATKERLRATTAWLTSHAQQLIVSVMGVVGVYMVISGSVRLLT